MSKLFGYLGQHKKAVALILVFVIVQVYCDLALPQYTSDIVDVGIQQSGIKDAVAETLSKETVEKLNFLMDDKDKKVFDENYTLDGDEYRYTGDKDDREELNDVLKEPMAIFFSMEKAAGETDKLSGAEMAMMKDEFGYEIARYMEENSSIVDQAAVEFVKEEYEKNGVDVGRIQMNYLWKTGFQMAALTLLMVIAAICTSYVAGKTGARIGRDARRGIFRKVMSFGSAEMDKFSTASLITRSTNDIQQIQMTCVMLLRMILMAPIMGIGACIKVVVTKTGMGWLTICAVVAVCIVMGAIIFITMPRFRIMQSLIDRVNLVSREIISGIPVIRAFSREEHEKQRFEDASRTLMKTQLFTQRTMSVMMPVLMLIMNGVSILIVWFGSKGADLGNLQVGDLIAFITYTMQIVLSFMMLAMAAVFIPRAGVAAERIDEVMKTQPSVVEKDNPVKLDNPAGKIRFDGVSFKYPGAEDNVIEDISFEAEPGKTTAIIGSTGCGKSTLLNLIPRFYDVTEGKITIDGVDIRDISFKDLRSLIGYVPQKGILFSGDIRSNIKFASDEISDEEMISAAHIAQASEFIESGQSGYDRAVAQGGSNVSGGQKQRLSIARAIAKNPKIYLFDDSFSALDYKTDAELRKNLNEKTENATVLIVAQRIATIRNADRIIVLDNGRITGTGTHLELLDSCSTYREIAESQLGEDELRKGAM